MFHQIPKQEENITIEGESRVADGGSYLICPRQPNAHELNDLCAMVSPGSAHKVQGVM